MSEKYSFIEAEKANYPVLKAFRGGARPIVAVARELGVIEQTLGNWVKAYRAEHAEDEPALSVPERIRLREAERELRELRLENEFLKKAAAYFAKERL